MKISLSTAQKLAIAGQGLDGGWKLPPGKEGVARAVAKLRAYAAFNGCEKTVIDETRPRKARAILNRQSRTQRSATGVRTGATAA